MNENVSVLKASTSYEGSVSPWWEESVFGDWSCGEPLTRQHLVVDFTPLEDQDTEYVQKKCTDFWNLVANSPELQGFMSLPEPKLKSTDGQFSSKNTRSTRLSTVTEDYEVNAISTLENAGEKGMISGAFETLIPLSCSATSREYHENEPSGAVATARADEMKRQPVCKCEVKSCRRRKPRQIQYSLPEIKSLNKTLGDWGREHPKSMDPPGRAPILSHSVMQRSIID